MAAAINVLLVDDDPIVRRAVKTMLQSEEDVNLVAEVTTVKEAFVFLNSLTLPHWNDLIIVTDIHLQQSDGVELSEIILRRNPEASILILTVNIGAERLEYLFKIGVKGIIFKDDCSSLNDAIHQVHAGELFIPEAIKNKLDIDFVKRRRLKKPGFSILSVRENKIVSLMCEGSSNEEIAKILGIDVESVYYAKHTARKKLGLKNDVQLGKAYADYFKKT